MKLKGCLRGGWVKFQFFPERTTAYLYKGCVTFIRDVYQYKGCACTGIRDGVYRVPVCTGTPPIKHHCYQALCVDLLI